MSVLLRRSNKSNEPTFAIQPKRLQQNQEPRDPEAPASDKDDRPRIFYTYWPWHGRFYTSSSFHHFVFGWCIVGIYRLYIKNAFYQAPIKLYIMHDGKQFFPYDDNMFTFSSVIIIGIAAINFAISMVPIVFEYYNMIHIREVNVVRSIVSGLTDAMCCFACNAHFGLHDAGSLFGCAFLAFTVSLFALLSEHFSYYSALFVSGHQRALPAIEVHAGTLFSAASLALSWGGPLARAYGAYKENTIETNPAHILEIFATIHFRVLVQSLAVSNMITYNIAEKITWILIVLELLSFAML